MSTSSFSSGDRPRRTLPLSPRLEQPQDERRQPPRTASRRDDLRHVNEELQQAQDELAQSGDAEADALEETSSTRPPEPIPPVAARALPRMIQTRTTQRIDGAATGVRRAGLREAARHVDKAPHVDESRHVDESLRGSSSRLGETRPREESRPGDELPVGGWPLSSLASLGRNWNRRQVTRYAIIAAVIIFTVWLAPIIAGHTPLRNLVLSSLASELNGTVTASSASFGWFSPVQLHDIEVRDDRGDLVLKVPTVKTSRTLRQIIFDSSNVGYIQLHRPQLRVAIEKNSSNVERLLSKILGSRESSMSSPKLDVEVVDGSATVEDLDARGRWQVEGLGAKLVLPRDWSGPLSLQVAGKVAQPGRGGQFDLRLDMTKSRQADGFVDSTGTIKCSASQFPLAMLQGGLSRYEPGIQLAGWFNGEAVYQWENDSRDGRPVTLEGNLTGEAVELRGPALGTDTLHLDQLQVPCRVVWQGKYIRIDRLGIACDAGHMNLAGSLAIDLTNGLAKGLNQALRTNAYDFKGEVDLAKLATLMPDTLSVRQGTHITQGKLNVELSRVAEKADRYAPNRTAGPVWKGQIVSTALRAVNDGRQVTWDQPIQVKFAAQEMPRGLNIQQLECRSDFVKLTASGEPSNLNVLAEYHLDKLASRLSDFFDLSNVALAGDGWSQFSWKRQDDGKIDLWCETQLDRFAVRLGKQQLLAEDKLEFKLQAALQADPQTRRLQRVEAGTLTVTSGPDRMHAKLAEPIELASASAIPGAWAPTSFTAPSTGTAAIPSMPSLGATGPSGRDPFATSTELTRPATPLGAASPASPSPGVETVWPLDIDLRGDVARWRNRLQPFISLPADWRVEGDAQVTAHLDLSRSQIHIHQSNARVRGVRAAIAGWQIDEPTLEMSVSAHWRPQDRRGEIAQALIQGASVAFNATQLSWSLPRRGEGWPTLAGEITFNVDLSEVQRWSLNAPRGKIAPKYRLDGDAAGRFMFVRDGQSATGTVEVWADKLSIAAAGSQAAWRDPRAHLRANLRYDQLSDVLHVSDLNVNTTTNTFSFSRGEGKLMQLRGACDLELRGYLAYSAQEVANVLFPAAAKDIEIKPGPSKEHPFYIKGMLGEVKASDPFARNPQQAARPLWARLTTGSQVDWTAANIYGFRFAAGEIRAEMREGHVYFQPLNLSMNGGRLLANPRIDLVGNPPKVVLEPPEGTAPGKPFTLVDRVQITPEMCNRGLKYALPTLYGVTEAQGQFSVRMKGCEIPLDDPFRGERAGELVVHDIQLAPGPMLIAIANVIDAARLASGKKPDTTSRLRVAKLKHESVVEYRMLDGKVYHNNLEMEFDGLTIITKGWVAIDQSINIAARVMAPGLTSRVPLAGAGQTEVTIPIAGTLDRPRIDTAALKTTALQDLLRSAPSNDLIRKGLEDGTKEVIRGIDNGLDRLINPRNR